MIERLPERVRTRSVAEAVVSPSAILLAGAGAAAAIAAGAALPLVAVAGIAGWAARVAMAVPRRRSGERVDPSRVREPWRRFVNDALEAQGKFGRVVSRSRPGPVRDTLEAVGRRIGDGVSECWRIARQGDVLDGAIHSLDEHAIYRELMEVREERQRCRDDEQAQSALARTQAAMEAQLASAQRLRTVAEDARNRLRLLNAQLDEAVARAVEITLQAGDVAQLAPLTEDVEGVVGELESLRQALEETSGSSGAGGPA